MKERLNILIVKLSAIGDVVHTLPALNAIRRHYPQAHISWLVEEAAADLVLGHPALDEVLVSRRKTWIKGLKSLQWRSHLKALTAFLGTLRNRRYDLLFDFQFSLKGAVLIALTHADRKIGFDRGLEHQERSYLVLNERIPAVSMEIHALERGLLMLNAVGIVSDRIEYRLPTTSEHQRQAKELLSRSGLSADQPYAAINPMAKWESKLWIPERFAAVADTLQKDYKLPVIFTGAPEDRLYIDAILGNMQTKAPNLAGQTSLLVLAALLQKATVMVTTDTGPMHIAAAVETPCVALFGPTAPWRTGPYGPEIGRASWSEIIFWLSGGGPNDNKL
ncbi:MAG: glycosyltransferase family 9 protein, partial [Desulfobacteraceae bacterium]|nr:glycosyltransferase family 9 protein [Desulfobacteraceae bacterium]